MDERLRPNAVAKLQAMEARMAELESRSADLDVARNPAESVRIAREIGQLRKLVVPFRDYQKKLAELQEAEQLRGGDDADLRELAAAEVEPLQRAVGTLGERLLNSLIADPGLADRNAIVEIRAGTGGEEAALFAYDLFRMYSHFAEQMRWKVEVLSRYESDMGGLREIILAVKGDDVFSRLRFESGGHRVQRVPATETQGRIHTSAATVAVLPEVEDVEIEVLDKDLRIDTMRSGGAGGQHVNKTESAVRITHEPTGVVVVCQDERSQHKNKARAMTILRARLYERELQRRAAERSAQRKSQVGSGDRNERIRTYNFPQNRVTDHRIHENFSLQQVVAGDLEPIIAALLKRERESRLDEL